MNDTSKRPVFTWILLGWIAVSFGLRLYFLDNLRWTYDEGIHVLLAQMLARGYTPYTELFVSYPPLYTWSIGWTWRLFGTIESLQILMSLYTMTGLLGVGLIAWRLGGLWAGICASIFLSLEPGFFRGSRGVLTEVPSISVAALAIACAAVYLWGDEAHKNWGWLAVSGVTLAASLMLKILSPFVAGLVPLMILIRQLQIGNQQDRSQFWRRLVIDGLIWGLALILPILAFTLIYDVPALFNQVIRFRFASRGAYEGEINNFLFMFSFLRDNWVISMLALVGLWPLGRQRLRQGWFVLIWLMLAVTFAMIQVPLRDKHLPLLLPPLSIMAGMGLGWLVQLARGMRRQKKLAGILSTVLVIALLLVYIWQTGQVFAGYNGYQPQYLSGSDQILVDFIQRFTAPDDCLITDAPTLAFVANRPVPPNLAEVSSARLRSGYLTYDELVSTTEAYGCQAVAPVAKRLKRTHPDFVEWAKGRFLGLWLYDGGTEVLLAQPIAKLQPTHPLHITFGEQVELMGFDVMQEDVGADRAVYLSLYWRARKPFTTDYTVFVHLRDGSNNTLVNGDHQPYNGHVPTSRWPVGQTVKETIRMDLPHNLPGGEYRIVVGLYSLDTLERLPVNDDVSGESAVVISGILVQ